MDSVNTQERDVCTKGKSCKLACIKSNLICRESLNENVQQSFGKFSNLVKRLISKVMPAPKPGGKAAQTVEKGRQFLERYNNKITSLIQSRSDLAKQNLSIRGRLSSKGKGELLPQERKRQEAQLAKNLAGISRKDKELIGVMAQMRSEILRSNANKVQVNAIVKNLDIIKGGSKEGKVRSQLAEFAQMFKGKGFANVVDTKGEVYPLTSVFVDKGRAWANTSMGHMQVDGSKGTVFHEMAHFLENQRPWLKSFSEKWRNGRAWDKTTVNEMFEGRPPTPVRSIKSGGRQLPVYKMEDLNGGRYRTEKDEVGVIDEFLTPYMGRVYKKGYTEVISVAMEHFATPEGMARLRRAHPELFEMVVGLSQN